MLGTPREFWNTTSALLSLKEAKYPIRQKAAGRLPRETGRGRMKDVSSVPISLLPGCNRPLPWTGHFVSLCLGFLICKMEIIRPTGQNDDDTCLCQDPRKAQCECKGLVHVSPSSSHTSSCHRAFAQAVPSALNPSFSPSSSQLKCHLLQEASSDLTRMSNSSIGGSQSVVEVYISSH